ncbi:hypothetical protein ABZV34_39615, partial [Streptomyces sp. NPDC005195]|uniref:hypothetical protein n=1 Tax=Streptomyces sp. NPDC005195 TaxID=3154561 RepID=UPI0033B963B7
MIFPVPESGPCSPEAVLTTEPTVQLDALEAGAVPSWLDQAREALRLPDGHEVPAYPSAEVPFAAVHRWHGAAATLIGQAAARRGADAAPHDALRALHARAAAGEPVGEEVWAEALRMALRETYRLAYPREQVWSRAASAASSFARTRGWTDDDAEQYGETYARMNTEVSERVHVEANAVANAAAYAAAFATGDAGEYARAWPFALVQAWAAACAGPDADDSATR